MILSDKEVEEISAQSLLTKLADQCYKNPQYGQSCIPFSYIFGEIDDLCFGICFYNAIGESGKNDLTECFGPVTARVHNKYSNRSKILKPNIERLNMLHDMGCL